MLAHSLLASKLISSALLLLLVLKKFEDRFVARLHALHDHSVITTHSLPWKGIPLNPPDKQVYISDCSRRLTY